MNKKYQTVHKVAIFIFLIVFSIFHVFSQNDKEEKKRAIIDLYDGSKIIGEISLKNIPFRADLIGEIDIPVNRLQYYKKETPETNATVKTLNSDFLSGKLLLERIQINTSIGELKIPVEKIKQVLVYTQQVSKNLYDALICRWCGEGNTQDSIGGLNGELLFGAEYADGKVGKSFSFNNLMARVHIPDSDKFKFKNSFTIECWVYANQLSDNSGMIICNRSDNRAGKDTFHLGTNGKDFNFYISNENDWCVISSPGKEMVWTHLAGVWDKEEKEIRFYINGQKVGQKKTTLEPIWELESIPDTGVGIGNHAGRFHVFPFNGKIDELGIYNRALSDDEIFSIYEAGERGEYVLPPEVVPKN